MGRGLIILVIFLTGCKQRQDGQSNAHFYDGEDLALINLLQELRTTDPAIRSSMNPGELDEAIDRQQRNTLIEMDLNSDTFIDEVERQSHFPPAVTGSLDPYDKNKDRRLDQEERSVLRADIAAQLTSSTGSFADRRDYICTHDQMKRFDDDELEHPLWQTVMAQCEGLEEQSDFALSYWDRRRQRCDRARAKEKEGAKSTFLQRILSSCNNSSR